jgi:REP element-mobilizing transposase RayT
MGDGIKELIRKIESTSDFKIDEMEVDVDHLHLMISLTLRRHRGFL